MSDTVFFQDFPQHFSNSLSDLITDDTGKETLPSNFLPVTASNQTRNDGTQTLIFSVALKKTISMTPLWSKEGLR